MRNELALACVGQLRHQTGRGVSLPVNTAKAQLSLSQTKK